MIKVFTTGKDPEDAGNILTKAFEDWQDTLNCGIRVTQVHSNSNKYGWMLVIVYEVIV